ncbi:MAG: HD-GYP domain-containing protein, partial [Tissierellia bacterium]|nr:HD-GYP domain-containing protein [Tissierellia bacterium]
ERWDGTGYPKGLTGEEIPLFARIISVAEGYDAMTNKVGGKGVTHEEAIDEIKSQSGIKFDPLVVNNFLEIINT